MAILELAIYPDKSLSRPAEPVKSFGQSLQKLADDMFETMYTYDGVGLAGPQVRVNKRILVCHPPDQESLCLVNPEIVERTGSEEGEEGCLSIPEIYAMVPRSTWIHVLARDPHGKHLDFEAADFLARVIQHEVDHLDGIVFLDRLDVLTRQAKLAEWEEVCTRRSRGPARAVAPVRS